MFAKWMAVVALLLFLTARGGSFPFDFGIHTQQFTDVQKSKISPDQERIQLAKKAADHFIQRWHETLDFNALFDDMYVSNAGQRQRNIYLFFVLYRCGAGLGYTPGFQKDVDESLRKRAFVAIQNMIYLSQEDRLAFDRSEKANLAFEQEIAKAGELFIDLDLEGSQKGRLSRIQIEEFIEKADYVSSVYRKNLSPSVFGSSIYKANLEEFLEGSDPPKIDQGWTDYGVKENEKVYVISRGVFRFYFIEEEGELKVLTLGFEC